MMSFEDGALRDLKHKPEKLNPIMVQIIFLQFLESK